MTQTTLVIVLDESLSMKEHQMNMISALNKLCDEQINMEPFDSARLILVKFNSKANVIYKGQKLSEIEKFNTSNYSPNGSTALYDAIVKAYQELMAMKSLEDLVIFAIFTDGKDMCSKPDNIIQVPLIFLRNKFKENWHFKYFGVNPDFWTKHTGMDVTDCMEINKKAPHENIRYLSTQISEFRKNLPSRDVCGNQKSD